MIECTTLVAVESSAARRNVIRFAEKLHDDQLQTWARNRERGVANKARPPSRAECLAKSVQIRRKREVDSHYWNDMVSARPIH